MKKFKFIGDPIGYSGFKKGMDYLGNFKMDHGSLSVSDCVELYPEDWEEVTEQEMDYDKFFEEAKKYCNRIPNQDQPASSMTKFEMAVFMVWQGLAASSDFDMSDENINAVRAIHNTKAIFKQLDELK